MFPELTIRNEETAPFISHDEQIRLFSIEHALTMSCGRIRDAVALIKEAAVIEAFVRGTSS